MSTNLAGKPDLPGHACFLLRECERDRSLIAIPQRPALQTGQVWDAGRGLGEAAGRALPQFQKNSRAKRGP
jgi:hypothetical protein